MAHFQHAGQVRGHTGCRGGPRTVHEGEAVGAPSHQHGLPDSHGVGVWRTSAILKGVREEFVSDQSMGALPLQGRRVPAAHISS